MDFVKKNIKYIGIAGCLIAIISTFLPFAKVSVSLFGFSSSQTVNFISGDGKIVLVLALLVGLFLLGKKLNFGFQIGNFNVNSLYKFWWGPLVLIAIALIITIYDASNIGKVSSGVGAVAGASVSFGIGFYLVLIGLIATAAAILYEKFGMKEEFVSEVVIEETTTETTKKKTTKNTTTCPKCGATVSKTANFCIICGEKLKK